MSQSELNSQLSGGGGTFIQLDMRILNNIVKT